MTVVTRSFHVVEQGTFGKAPPANDDAIVETPVLVAVIDGATSKHDRRWSFQGEGCTSGTWAARTLARALQDVAADWTARQAVDHLTDALAQGCLAAHGDVPREELPSASVVLVHGPRRELWAVGDCHWAIDGHPTRTSKRIDELAAEVRAAAHAAFAAGALAPGDDKDPARAVILPLLRVQGALAGTAGEFGYGHLDGRPVLPEHLVVVPLDPGAEVILATDGYPELHPDLERTEQALRRALAADPHCVRELRGTKGVDQDADSFDDRTYVRLRLSGDRPAAAEGVTVPRALVTAVLQDVDRCDFSAVRRKLDALELPRHVAQPARSLARAGQLLVRLDLEDLHDPPRVAEPLRSRLREVCLPQSPGRRPEGLLASLRPATDLVLDVIALEHEQDDVDALLTAVHLLHEALPLLAWETTLDHTGDPARLQRLAGRSDSRWGSSTCPSKGPGFKAAQALAGATRDAASWQLYLERSWSLLGTQLEDCAACTLTCAVGASPGERRDDLRRRLALRRVFGRSALVGLRHGSTVGHAFAVPDLHEVDRAWRRTRAQIAKLAPDVQDDDGHPLPGLRTLVGLVAGAPVAAAGLLADVRLALRREVEDLHPTA